MEELYFTLLKTPMLITCILIGLVCSLFALFAFQRLPEKLKNEKMRVITVIGFVGVCMSLSMTNYPEYLKSKIADHMTENTRSDTFYAAVYKHHPEAQESTISVIKTLAETAADYPELQVKAQDRIAHIAHDYLFGDIITASDDAVFDYMNHSLLILETLSDKPATCKSYGEGEYDVIAAALPPAMHKKDKEIKASIITASVSEPFPLAKVYDINSYYEHLKSIYEDAGYSENDLLALENVSNLPPVEACKQSIRFMSVLTALGNRQGPIMFKNLMLASN